LDLSELTADDLRRLLWRRAAEDASWPAIPWSCCQSWRRAGLACSFPPFRAVLRKERPSTKRRPMRARRSGCISLRALARDGGPIPEETAPPQLATLDVW